MNEAREAAIERLVERRRLRELTSMYVAFGGFFIVLWAMEGGGFFWPAFVLVGWGLHLAICALGSYSGPITPEEIAAEMDRAGAAAGGVR